MAFMDSLEPQECGFHELMTKEFCEETLSAKNILNTKIFPTGSLKDTPLKIKINKAKKYEYQNNFEELNDVPKSGEAPTFSIVTNKKDEDNRFDHIETRTCDNFVLEYHIKINFKNTQNESE